MLTRKSNEWLLPTDSSYFVTPCRRVMIRIGKRTDIFRIGYTSVLLCSQKYVFRKRSSTTMAAKD